MRAFLCFLVIFSMLPARLLASGDSAYQWSEFLTPGEMSILTGEQILESYFMSPSIYMRRAEGVGTSASDIFIRGLSAQDIPVLLNGRRILNDHAVQTFALPPVASIERVEIVRGAMATMYGSDAIGGVMNFVTRRPTDHWDATFAAGYGEPENSGGASYSGSFWMGGPLSDALSLQLHAGFDGGSGDQEDDPIRARHRKENHGGQLAWRLTPAQKLTLGMDVNAFKHEEKDSTGVSGESRIDSQRYYLEHELDFEGGKSTLMIDRLEQDTEPEGVPGANSDSRLINESVIAQVVFPFERNTLKLGAEWYGAELEFPSGPGSADRRARRQERYSLYGKDLIELDERITLLAGIRVDDYSNYDRRVTRSLYGNYRLASHWHFRAGFSQNYRAPSLRQASGAYCQPVGGFTAPHGILCGNPGLEPEKSLNEEIGLRYEDPKGRTFGLMFFSSVIEDKIVLHDSGSDPLDPNRALYAHANQERLRLEGVELSARQPLGAAWEISGTYTYTESSQRGEYRALDRAPEHAGSLRLDWAPRRGLSTHLSAGYLGNFRSAAVAGGKRGASTTLDLGASYLVISGLRLNAGVLNLTDSTVPVEERSRANGLDGYRVVDEGRRYWLSATYSF